MSAVRPVARSGTAAGRSVDVTHITSGASAMSLVPRTKQDKVNFYQSKITPWTTNATAIGTTSSAVTALNTLVTAAADALAAQTVAEAAWRSSVETSDLAVAAMATAGANII